MGANAQLSTTTLDVEPGRTASLTVTVRNTGSVVDRFSFEAVGGAASWVTFTPDTLSLFPDATGTVSVLFAPPKESNVAAGPLPFGVRVASNEDPAGSVVEEGTLQVSPFSDVSVELVPRIARGSRMGRVRIAVDNRSNCSYRADLAAIDGGGVLGFRFSPDSVDVPPGGAQFVKLGIRAKKTFWRGPSTTKQFRVTLKNRPLPVAAGAPSVSSTPSPAGTSPAAGPGGAGSAEATPPGGTPAVGTTSTGATTTAATPKVAPSPHPPEVHADGSMMQDALVPRWLLAALAILVALAALILILWFALFKPQIKSTANQAARNQLAAAGITPSGASPSSSSPGAGAGSAGSGSGGSGSGTSGSSTSETTVVPTSAGSSSVTASGVTVNGTSQASGNGTRTVYVVPSGHVLQITDLLVENSAGNTGTLSIAKSGTVLMQWALANFRDLDYHWIAPTIFPAGSTVQIEVSGCPNTCTPGIYYAGNLVKSS